MKREHLPEVMIQDYNIFTLDVHVKSWHLTEVMIQDYNIFTSDVRVKSWHLTEVMIQDYNIFTSDVRVKSWQGVCRGHDPGHRAVCQQHLGNHRRLPQWLGAPHVKQGWCVQHFVIVFLMWNKKTKFKKHAGHGHLKSVLLSQRLEKAYNFIIFKEDFWMFHNCITFLVNA